MTAPLTIWAVSDGRAGIEAQVLAMAEAVARRRPAQIIVKRIGWKAGAGRLPWRMNPFPRGLLEAESPIEAPWPDIWIAAGRATLPLSVRMRAWSQERAFVVQLQDPRTDPGHFDLVIPPQHDGLTGANVVPILGSPSRMTPQALAQATARFSGLIGAFPAPRVTVAVGGASKAFTLPAGQAARIADQVRALVEAQGGSVMVTFSRRTPDAARRALRAKLSHLPGWIWDGQGANPYLAFLGAADHVLITEDSVNMAIDAAVSGKPVHILPMAPRPGAGPRKFRAFHRALAEAGVSRPFDGQLATWTYAPLAEADRAAGELLARLDARTEAAG